MTNLSITGNLTGGSGGGINININSSDALSPAVVMVAENRS